jgi:hypothetical protein
MQSPGIVRMVKGPNDSEHWILVDFESARINAGSRPGSYTLTVSGYKPSDSERGSPVKLVPATYVVRPAYWKISVLWNDANAIFQSVTPFEISISLDSICGTQGVEIIGKNRSEKISL